MAQIPKHQGTARLDYQRKATMVSFGVRAYSYQFDDDLNQFRLPGYAALELAARQRVAGISAGGQAAIDNLLDRQYYTAFTPTPNIGQPRLWRMGLRWDGKL